MNIRTETHKLTLAFLLMACFLALSVACSMMGHDMTTPCALLGAFWASCALWS